MVVSIAFLEVQVVLVVVVPSPMVPVAVEVVALRVVQGMAHQEVPCMETEVQGLSEPQLEVDDLHKTPPVVLVVLQILPQTAFPALHTHMLGRTEAAEHMPPQELQTMALATLG